MQVELVNGDCRQVLADMPAGSVDAIVCDPPYELGFMGRSWDRTGVGFDVATWLRCFEVLQPGGHLVAFGGTRTYHRLACAIEDAGFEIRDQLCWLFGSGFPKSMNVAAAIDKHLGVAGELGGPRHALGGGITSGTRGSDDGWRRPWMEDEDAVDRASRMYLPASEQAQAFDGWGTALKPGHEPIVLARKPFTGTVAANVVEHGVGAINVDACRVAFASEEDERESKTKNAHGDFDSGPRNDGTGRVFGTDLRTGAERGNYDPTGRWPANVILDDEAAVMLDAQSPVTKSTGTAGGNAVGRNSPIYGNFSTGSYRPGAPIGFGDVGGASRFFYVAKADRVERDAGLDAHFPRQPLNWSSGDANPGSFQSPGTDRTARNHHPTVKPVDLMRWLVRLVTPPGGLVVDPFMGSGTTGVACVLEGFRFVGIELDTDHGYMDIARARIAHARDAAAAGTPFDARPAKVASGQDSLF
jgi:DNA modification methylase